MEQKDLEKIRKYIEITDKLINSRFFKETRGFSCNIEFKAGKGLKQSVAGFDEDLLRSFLLDFRKIYLNNDNVNFYFICSLIYQNTSDENIKNNVAKCRAIFSELLNGTSPLKLVLNGKEITKKEILDMWLFGYYFHEKVESPETITFNKLGAVRGMNQIRLVDLIIDLTKVVICLANNARLELGK